MLKSTYRAARLLNRTRRTLTTQLGESEDTLWRLERDYVLVEQGTKEDAVKYCKTRIETIKESLAKVTEAFAAL